VLAHLHLLQLLPLLVGVLLLMAARALAAARDAGHCCLQARVHQHLLLLLSLYSYLPAAASDACQC
jgi:hypothetical protein